MDMLTWEEGSGVAENIIEEIINENPPNFDKNVKLEIEEAQQTPNMKKTRDTPGYFIVKLLKGKDK